MPFELLFTSPQFNIIEMNILRIYFYGNRKGRILNMNIMITSALLKIIDFLIIENEFVVLYYKIVL